MLTSLIIHNFQSHKNSELEFDSGVNVIVGQSDSGKSAIFRALIWLLVNRPSGEAFRSLWGGDTSVGLMVSDSNSVRAIQRFRGKGKNSYVLDGLDYKAIGQDVPEQIAEALNVNSTNTQAQHDSPFLLSSSPGEIAAALNEAASLSDIDKAMSTINSMARQKTQDIKVAKELIAADEADLERYSGLDELEDALKRCEKLYSAISVAKNSEQSLRNLLAWLNETLGNLERGKSVLKISKEVASIASKEVDLAYAIASEKNLSVLLKELDVVERWRKEAAGALEKAEKEFKMLMPNVCPLCGSKV